MNLQEQIEALEAMIATKKGSVDKLDLMLVRNWEAAIRQLKQKK